MLNPGEMYGEEVSDVPLAERVAFRQSGSFQRMKVSHPTASAAPSAHAPVFVPAKGPSPPPSSAFQSSGAAFITPAMLQGQQIFMRSATAGDHVETEKEFSTELPMPLDIALHTFAGWLETEFEIEDCVARYVREAEVFKITGPAPESVLAVFEMLSARAGFEVVDEEDDVAEAPSSSRSIDRTDMSMPEDLYSTLPRDGRREEAEAIANAEAALKAAGRRAVEGGSGWVESRGASVDPMGEFDDEEKADKDILKQARLIVKLETKVQGQAKVISDFAMRDSMREDRERQHMLRIQQLEAALAGLQHHHGILQHQHAAQTQHLHMVAAERDMILHDMQAALADLTQTKAVVADSGRYISHQSSQMAMMNQEIMCLRAGNMHQHDIIMKKMAREQEMASSSFSLASIKEAIECAVGETIGMADDERKSKIKALRMRWHPDKNPILKEFATEVTKIINESVRIVEQKAAEVPSEDMDHDHQAMRPGSDEDASKQPTPNGPPMAETPTARDGKENDAVASNRGVALGMLHKSAVPTPAGDVSDEEDGRAAFF